MADPLHQFQIVPLVDFGTVTLPVVGEQQLAFTNSHLAMTIAFGLVVLFLQLGHRRAPRSCRAALRPRARPCSA